MSLNQKRTNSVALDANHLLIGVSHTALPHSIHRTVPPIGGEVLHKLRVHAFGKQIVAGDFVKVVIQQKVGQLFLTSADGITTIARVAAEEHVENELGVLHAELENGISHGKLVEVHVQSIVAVILPRNERSNGYASFFFHDEFPPVFHLFVISFNLKIETINFQPQ